MHKYLILLFLLFPMICLSEEDTIIETDIETESTASDDAETEETTEYKTKNAKIQILNKITAKSHYVEVPVNSQITFGTIKIKIFFIAHRLCKATSRFLDRRREKHVECSHGKCFIHATLASHSAVDIAAE